MKHYRTFLLATAPLIMALAASPATAADNTMNKAGADKDTGYSHTMDQKSSMDRNSAKGVGDPSAGSASMQSDRLDRETTGAKTDTSMRYDSGDLEDAKQLVDESVAVIDQMKADEGMKQLLAKAKGIYVVPDFGRGALIVGARGGSGVVLTKNNGKWTDPAFYNFGAISVGAQAGASAGSVAFILMSQDAVDAFKDGNQFSVNADSGLSIINYSANAQASWGKGDIVLWSDTEGAYAGATLSVSDINWDDDSNAAYYGKKVDPSQIFAGNVSPKGNPGKLKQALPAG